MSIQTELLTERINKIDQLLPNIQDDVERLKLIDEKTQLMIELRSASGALQEGRQLLKD